MALLTSEILEQTDTTVTVKYTRRSGATYTKTINLIEGVELETLLKRHYTRTTLATLQNRIRFTRPETAPTE